MNTLCSCILNINFNSFFIFTSVFQKFRYSTFQTKILCAFLTFPGLNFLIVGIGLLGFWPGPQSCILLYACNCVYSFVCVCVSVCFV